jgi:response regulator of citrate/malate metabolism
MSSSLGPVSQVSVLKGVSVLVVEDSWHVAKATRTVLEQFGMRVIGLAATTSEARRLVAVHKPQVALVDLHLTTELAYSLIEELHGQGVLIIVISGYGAPTLPETMAATFLRKPFCESDLITILCATSARLH